MTPVSKPPPPHVVIVGGGLAGLAVASSLVNRGLRITILESRPRLGGRASSFPDPATGELVDNCQHVSMGCCTNLADFCRRVGLEGMMRRDEELFFLSAEGQVSRFRAGVGPAPLHLAGSLLRAQFLEQCRQGCDVAYGMAVSGAASATGRRANRLRDWLLRHRQSVRSHQSVLGDGAGLGLERAPRANGRGPRSQGFPRRVLAESTRVSARASARSSGRALRNAARELAPGAQRRGSTEDGRPRGRARSRRRHQRRRVAFRRLARRRLRGSRRAV